MRHGEHPIADGVLSIAEQSSRAPSQWDRFTPSPGRTYKEARGICAQVLLRTLQRGVQVTHVQLGNGIVARTEVGNGQSSFIVKFEAGYVEYACGES